MAKEIKDKIVSPSNPAYVKAVIELGDGYTWASGCPAMPHAVLYVGTSRARWLEIVTGLKERISWEEMSKADKLLASNRIMYLRKTRFPKIKALLKGKAPSVKDGPSDKDLDKIEGEGNPAIQKDAPVKTAAERNTLIKSVVKLLAIKLGASIEDTVEAIVLTFGKKLMK